MKHIRNGLLISLLAISISTSVLAEEVTVTVKGLVCSFCAQGIKKTFGRNPDVTSTNVDLENKIVKLTLKEGSKLSDKDIEQAINDAGYAVVKIERDGHV